MVLEVCSRFYRDLYIRSIPFLIINNICWCQFWKVYLSFLLLINRVNMHKWIKSIWWPSTICLWCRRQLIIIWITLYKHSFFSFPLSKHYLYNNASWQTFKRTLIKTHLPLRRSWSWHVMLLKWRMSIVWSVPLQRRPQLPQ